ncbi:MAG: ATP-binding protein, partial [Bacteroidales bacterium]|nr:ATP-binding protein [Bacteroidales bacterium]
MLNIEEGVHNPFVGLRPFGYSERHFFFGQEEHVNTIVQKLQKNQFVLITGASGTGKSSLVNCEIIPAMISRYKVKVIRSEIGFSPLEDLLGKVSKIASSEDPEDPEVKNIKVKRTEVLKFLQHNFKQNKTGYLFFIDHFERLFHSAGPSSQGIREIRS